MHAKLAHMTERYDKAARTMLTAHQMHDKGKDEELKDNFTDPESAKHQTIGSGSEQQALMPMIEASGAVRGPNTLIKANAGYHCNENLKQLRAHSTMATIADGDMRKRDEQLRRRKTRFCTAPLAGDLSHGPPDLQHQRHSGRLHRPRRGHC